MLRFLGYIVTTFLGGIVLGMPIGMLLSFGLARRVAPYSQWVIELEPVDAALTTPAGMAAIHLRWTTRALVGVGSAIGCGAAAALHQHHYGAGNLVVWQITMMLCAASFWEFKVLLAIPAVAGWLLTRGLLQAF
jgi:hypothetical protein